MKKRPAQSTTLFFTLLSLSFLSSPPGFADIDHSSNQGVLSPQSQTQIPVQFPPPLIDLAAEYHTYLRHAHAIKSHFETGSAIEKALMDAESYEMHQLARGAVAYGAVLAVQDPSFASGLRRYVGHETVRRELITRILTNPNYITVMPGALAAARLIVINIGSHGQKMMDIGSDIRQEAYKIQKQQPWSNDTVSNLSKRLSTVRQLSYASMTPVTEDADIIRAALAGDRSRLAIDVIWPSPSDQSPVTFNPFLLQSLNLAALALLGEGSVEHQAEFMSILEDNTKDGCLHMSKLNLLQCLAVARPWYEDMFCLGVHALSDTGQCLKTLVGNDALSKSNMIAGTSQGNLKTGGAEPQQQGLLQQARQTPVPTGVFSNTRGAESDPLTNKR